jgi:flagellar hook assembly protein FlgD
MVDLRIYDATGRLVQKLVNESLEAGVHTLRWDGRNVQGVAVPSGIYFWRFSGAGLHRADKFVVLK